MVERIFAADNRELSDVLAFAEEQMDALGCSMKTSMAVSVSLEEMFVNVANYAYPQGGGQALISLDAADGVLTICIKDSGIPFDPLAKEDPNVTLSAEERDIGGLGIFMVKKSMDYVDYRRENDQNIFVMKKKI